MQEKVNTKISEKRSSVGSGGGEKLLRCGICVVTGDNGESSFSGWRARAGSPTTKHAEMS